MSTATLRHHGITLSFLAHRRDRQLGRSIKILRIRASRRRLKQTLRGAISKYMNQTISPIKESPADFF